MASSNINSDWTGSASPRAEIDRSGAGSASRSRDTRALLFDVRSVGSGLLQPSPGIPAAADLPTWKRLVFSSSARPSFMRSFTSVSGHAPASVLSSLTRTTGFSALLPFIVGNGLEYAWFDEPTAVLTYESATGQFALYAPVVWAARCERKADAGASRPPDTLDVSNETLQRRAFEASDPPCVSIGMPVSVHEALDMGQDYMRAFDVFVEWLQNTCDQVVEVTRNGRHVKLRHYVTHKTLLHFLDVLPKDAVFTSEAGFLIMDFDRRCLRLMSREYYYRVCEPGFKNAAAASSSTLHVIALPIVLAQAELAKARAMAANPVVTPRPSKKRPASPAPTVEVAAPDEGAGAGAGAGGGAVAPAAPVKRARFGPAPGWSEGRIAAINQALAPPSPPHCASCQERMDPAWKSDVCGACWRYRDAVTKDIASAVALAKHREPEPTQSFGGFETWDGEKPAPDELTPSDVAPQGLAPVCGFAGCTERVVHEGDRCPDCVNIGATPPVARSQDATRHSRAFYAAHYAAMAQHVTDLEAAAVPGGVVNPWRWRFSPGALVRVKDSLGSQSNMPWQVRARALNDDGYAIYILTNAPDHPERTGLGELAAHPRHFHEVLERSVQAWM